MHVEQSITSLQWISETDRMRLRKLAWHFIQTKVWSAAGGLTLTADIQMSISLQASLPVLNWDLSWLDDWVGIVVYPGDFVISRQIQDENGLVHEFDDAVLGEAWEGGPLIISWLPGVTTPEGINVVLHEIAHKLDMRGGFSNGDHRFLPPSIRTTWGPHFEAAYRQHAAAIERGAETAIDPYGAENPIEFFAVLCEEFFEQPHTLSDTFPEIYADMTCLFQQDPLAACFAHHGVDPVDNPMI